MDARLAIKHKDYTTAKQMLGGILSKYLTSDEASDDLSYALKIVINIVYGLTSAKFENKFKDPRNIDNIVAKRGALFMIDLKHEVQERGFKVAHIKTDSIKIPDATQEIIDFVFEFGKKYGYTFEHEATYDKLCLVNDSVYIARFKGGKRDGKWTPTGAQFAQPYVYKTLFSGEPIMFEDMCETKSVSTALYLDMNENLPDVYKYEKERDAIWKKLLSKDTIPNIEADMLETNLMNLEAMIKDGHNYQFVGKVGSFCPIKKGCGGGELMREKDGKFGHANGCKGYKWLEVEVVKVLNKQEDIDRDYYNGLVDSAVATISKFGDFEWFISDDNYHQDINNDVKEQVPCGDNKYTSCFDCPSFVDESNLNCDMGYNLSTTILKGEL